MRPANRNLVSPANSFSSPGDSSSTLLPIVQAQRERFRLRNEELESSSLEQQHQLSIFSAQVNDLLQDNVKLYEKIRFLQSCGGASRRQGEVMVPVETRYQSEYEQKLDPFQSFSQAEKKRKYGQLSVMTRSTEEVPIDHQKYEIFKASQSRIWVLRLIDICFGIM